MNDWLQQTSLITSFRFNSFDIAASFFIKAKNNILYFFAKTIHQIRKKIRRYVID